MNRQIVTTSKKCSLNNKSLVGADSISKWESLGVKHVVVSYEIHLNTEMELNIGDIIDLKVIQVLPKVYGNRISQTIDRTGEELHCRAIVSSCEPGGYLLISSGEVTWCIGVNYE